MKRADLTGARFGRLVAVSRTSVRLASTGGHRLTAWRCRCDCGGSTQVLAFNLRKGHTRSCGCLRAVPRRSA